MDPHEWKQERPSWCPHEDCIFKRRVMDAFCSGNLPAPVPHNAGFNDYRVCLNCREDGEILDFQVNDTDLAYLRWVFDAVDGLETSWLSRRS